MKSRKLHVRTKVVALLASFAALWAFAAYVTVRDGFDLLGVGTLDSNIGRPAESMVAALQQERRLSVVTLAGGSDQRAALTTQRARTDDAVRAFRRLAGSGSTKLVASALLEQRVSEVFGRLDRLGRIRDAIDHGNINRAATANAFTDMITATFRIYSAEATLDDLQIAREGDVLIALSRAREVLSQEDTLLAGVISAGRFIGNEHADFVQLVGAQRLLHDDTAAQLPRADRDRYRQFTDGAAGTRLRSLEDLVIEKGRAGAAPPVDAQAWNGAFAPAFDELRVLILKSADGTIARAKPVIAGIVVRVLVSVLGLIAVIAAIVMSITTARSLVGQLVRLRGAALALADEKLPGVVDRLRRGEEVDVAGEAPPVPYGSGVIGQVGQAFNAVQETAVRSAVEQAELRRGVRDVFLSLARRTQTLVHRQLAMLDEMERRATDPEDLADLFRVDHLATRMRRNAENLIVLSGAVPGRGWRRPVPVVDVVRGAVAEIEDYERVTVLPIGPSALSGRVVGDVIHLLAELLDNATSFSPPNTPVHVGGQKVANGFVIEIEDRGLGMTERDLALADEQLSHPPEFALSGTVRLGLYVVGRLAERHGIRVTLRGSPYGGTTAIVLLPASMVVDADDAETPPVGIDGATRIAVESGPARPETPEPVASPEPVVTGNETPNGLPRRVRQANLAAPLRKEPVTTVRRPTTAHARAPEDIRQMLASYQRQTRRGRSDAEATATSGENPGVPQGEDHS